MRFPYNLSLIDNHRIVILYSTQCLGDGRKPYFIFIIPNRLVFRVSRLHISCHLLNGVCSEGLCMETGIFQRIMEYNG